MISPLMLEVLLEVRQDFNDSKSVLIVVGIIVLIPSLMKWMYSMKHLSVKSAMLSLHWSSFFIAISLSQTLSKMTNTKIDHTTSNKPVYTVAIRD